MPLRSCNGFRRDSALGSRSHIESELGGECDTFAYTWGRYSVRLRKLAVEAGYRYAFSGRHGPVDVNGDPMTIPRINISNDYTLDDFKAIVHGDWDYLGWIHRFKGL